MGGSRLAPRPAGPWRDIAWIAGFAAAFVVITGAVAAGGPLLDLDLAVRAWSEAHRPPAADLVARVVNHLGQGFWLILICLLLAEWLAVRTRDWRPLAYAGIAAVLTSGAVLSIKYVTDRGAPSSLLPPERTVRLFGDLPPGEYAASYPAGHVVNAVIWYGVGLLLITALLRSHLLPAPAPALLRGVRVAVVVVLVGTTTYLSFHWLTDGLAGLALGLLIDRLIRPLAPEPGAAGPARARAGPVWITEGGGSGGRGYGSGGEPGAGAHDPEHA